MPRKNSQSGTVRRRGSKISLWRRVVWAGFVAALGVAAVVVVSSRTTRAGAGDAAPSPIPAPSISSQPEQVISVEHLPLPTPSPISAADQARAVSLALAYPQSASLVTGKRSAVINLVPGDTSLPEPCGGQPCVGVILEDYTDNVAAEVYVDTSSWTVVGFQRLEGQPGLSQDEETLVRQMADGDPRVQAILAKVGDHPLGSPMLGERTSGPCTVDRCAFQFYAMPDGTALAVTVDLDSLQVVYVGSP